MSLDHNQMLSDIDDIDDIVVSYGLMFIYLIAFTMTTLPKMD